jgi:hypothetical protein
MTTMGQLMQHEVRTQPDARPPLSMETVTPLNSSRAIDLRTTARSSFTDQPSSESCEDPSDTISIHTQQSPIDSSNVQINSNDATNSSSDLLATSHLSLPAGAGVSWSAPPIHSTKNYSFPLDNKIKMLTTTSRIKRLFLRPYCALLLAYTVAHLISIIHLRQTSQTVQQYSSFNNRYPTDFIGSLGTRNYNSSLRFDWTHVPPMTPLGMAFEGVQSRCLNASYIEEHGPLEVYQVDMRPSGMGSVS